MQKLEGIGLVIAELENGQEIKCKTSLVGYGYYKEWREDMHPDGIGWYETFIEVEINEVEAKYPNEYGNNEIDFQDIRIKSIKQVLSDVDWEVI